MLSNKKNRKKGRGKMKNARDRKWKRSKWTRRKELKMSTKKSKRRLKSNDLSKYRRRKKRFRRKSKGESSRKNSANKLKTFSLPSREQWMLGSRNLRRGTLKEGSSWSRSRLKGKDKPSRRGCRLRPRLNKPEMQERLQFRSKEKSSRKDR